MKVWIWKVIEIWKRSKNWIKLHYHTWLVFLLLQAILSMIIIDTIMQIDNTMNAIMKYILYHSNWVSQWSSLHQCSHLTCHPDSVFEEDVHVAYVNDFANEEVRLYVNGELSGFYVGNFELKTIDFLSPLRFR